MTASQLQSMRIACVVIASHLQCIYNNNVQVVVIVTCNCNPDDWTSCTHMHMYIYIFLCGSLV